jgi:maltokinase
MRERLDAAIGVVPGLAPYADDLRATYDAVERIAQAVPVQRVHGDYHLGQTLRTVRGWKIVDFEGEPAKPLAERVLPDSPWRDVAGMLRSFDYAAHAVEADVQADSGDSQIAYRAAEWAERNQHEFLAGYVEATYPVEGDEPAGEPDPATALPPHLRTLLRAYQADKAVYEAVYEARNRPSWIGIPLGAIERLTAPAPEEQT